MTELIWDGKYKDGKKVAPLRVSLPFQTVETVNESVQQRQRTLDLFTAGRDMDWRNRLIWGDKKYVLPSLLDEFSGKVNLIYIDPPFNVGADFSFNATLPDYASTDDDETTEFVKEPNVIEQKAYRDTWGNGLESYLQWFYETIVFLRDLLSDDGSIYVHLDWHMVHYAKVLMDEVFGYSQIRNALVWKRTSAHNDPQRFGIIDDSILFYSKSKNWKWNALKIQYEAWYIERYYKYVEKTTGRRFLSRDVTGPSHGGTSGIYEWKGKLPGKGRMWAYTRENMEKLEADGKLFYTDNGVPRLKQYLDEMEGNPVQSIWDDILPVVSWSNEGLSYETQKPEALLDRVIKSSSNEGDLILDCFCGSGTTPAVAEKLNRRWIACDLGRFAIHTTRKRLLGIEGVKPFIVQNLGKYERQAWIQNEFENQNNLQKKYREFILDLYHARALNQYTWLHGIKSGRMVHVGSVDGPVTAGDLANIATEFKKAVGSGSDAPQSNAIDVLGWDFAFEINEVAKQQASQANLDFRFYRVPRDVMDKRAVEQGDIRFFELAALKVDVQVNKLAVDLEIEDFVIPPDDVPQDVQKSIKHWSQWVDYWAVDWDFKGDTFHNQWQTYRTRKDPTLKLKTEHHYEQAGEYVVMVKVIDILGNDTTKTLKVKVG